MKKAIVSFSEEKKTYEITIGQSIIHQISSLVALDRYSHVFVVTDATIQKLWLQKVLASFAQKPYVLVLPSGESSKTIHSVEVIWKEMQSVGCDRRSLVITLGGGVIGDIGGFAASTYMRGLDVLQIPTSLLAAVDASIGGKTGIDFLDIKNLIGTFHQPIGVVIDIAILQTLPTREFVNGFAELIKHGIIYDEAYFEEVTAKSPKDFSQDELIDIIARSCEIKAAIVSQDQKEQGIRKIVNFGHTIGHALEALSWKTENPLLHGEAVGIGMIVESEISKRTGLLSVSELQTIKHKIKDVGLPAKIKGITTNEIMEKIISDKKNVSGKIRWVLLQHIGKAIYDQEVEQGLVVQSIESALT